MATISKRGGRWTLQWTEGGRQRRLSLGTADRREAERLRKLKSEELHRARLAGVVQLPEAGAVPTLREFVLLTYAPWRAAEYPASAYRNAGVWDNHLLPEFGDLALDRISKTRVENWKARAGRQVKPATVEKWLRTLQAALNRAVFLDVIRANPVRGVKAPRSLDDAPALFYTPALLEQLYAHAQHLPGDEAAKGLPPLGWADWAPVWRLMACTGLRRTEALQLRWDHVEGETLRVVSTEAARTKSGRWRAVPLSEGAVEALAALRPQTEASGYVLPRVHPDALTAAFRRHLQRAGLPGHLHCLRHTFCSTLVQAGVPLRAVQLLAGHASITTTERYAHLSDGNLRDAVRALHL